MPSSVIKTCNFPFIHSFIHSLMYSTSIFLSACYRPGPGDRVVNNKHIVPVPNKSIDQKGREMCKQVILVLCVDVIRKV